MPVIDMVQASGSPDTVFYEDGTVCLSVLDTALEAGSKEAHVHKALSHI